MQFDWVYVTGDLPPHNVWNQTREDMLQDMEVMAGICAVIYLFITFFILRRKELLGISLKHFFISLLLPSPPLLSFMF